MLLVDPSIISPFLFSFFYCFYCFYFFCFWMFIWAEVVVEMANEQVN